MRILAGYRITVTTWENDADNFKTASKDGLTENQVRFYADVCKRMKSKNQQNGHFGNMYEPDEAERDAFCRFLNETVEKNGGILQILPDTEEEDIPGCNGDFSDWLADSLWDLGLMGGDFYTHVCSKFVVTYIQHEINLPDVTSKFA